jgi:hypothetical protein
LFSLTGELSTFYYFCKNVFVLKKPKSSLITLLIRCHTRQPGKFQWEYITSALSVKYKLARFFFMAFEPTCSFAVFDHRDLLDVTGSDIDYMVAGNFLKTSVKTTNEQTKNNRQLFVIMI